MDALRIRIVESGGFAGLRKERAVETERLPARRRVTIERLIERATFFELPARLVSGLPDVIQYRVRIEDETRAHEVLFDDEQAPEPLRTLVLQLLGAGDEAEE
jgi:emfourin